MCSAHPIRAFLLALLGQDSLEKVKTSLEMLSADPTRALLLSPSELDFLEREGILLKDFPADPSFAFFLALFVRLMMKAEITG